MSLMTGCVINRIHATPMLMPAEVIDTVERLATAQEAKPGLAFHKYEDDDDDEYLHCESQEVDLEYTDDVGEDKLEGEDSLMDHDGTPEVTADTADGISNHLEVTGYEGGQSLEEEVETADHNNQDVLSIVEHGETTSKDGHACDQGSNYRSGVINELGIVSSETELQQEMDRKYG